MPLSQKNIRTPKGFLGVVDVGSFKTVCLIAKIDKKGLPLRILGVGIARSAGIRSGLIVDISAAQESIRSAIAGAEEMAGVQLTDVDVAVNCGNQKSQAFNILLPVRAGPVDQATLSLLHLKAIEYAQGEGRSLLNLNPVSYQLRGGSPATLQPLGLYSEGIGGFFHAVTAELPALTNLFQTFDRCYLTPNLLLPGSLASALAVTEEEERNSGVIVLDIGAGVTGIAVFAGGRYVFSETVAMGGGDITVDIARGLRAPLEEAERIKTLYGTVWCAPSNHYDLIPYTCREGGERTVESVTMADVTRIIRGRVTAVLDHAYHLLLSRGILNSPLRGIVLCGGSSGLPGITGLAETIFKKDVREGRPNQISGLPPLYSASAFSSVVGLLKARTENVSALSQSQPADRRVSGYFSRVGVWLREGF